MTKPENQKIARALMGLGNMPSVPLPLPRAPMVQPPAPGLGNMQVAVDYSNPLARANLRLGQLLRDRSGSSGDGLQNLNLRIDELRQYIRSGGITPLHYNSQDGFQ